MKKLLLILLCLPMIGFGQACQYGSLTDASEICDYVRGLSFSSDRNAESALELILNATESSQKFALKECSNISNCIATTYKGIRYILYDKEFMDAIAARTNSWSKTSILAHEIGHHVYGHTMSEPSSLAESRQMELEADEYSGFVMFKLGVSLIQAQEAVRLISTNKDDSYSTHPSKDRRLKAIEKGYRKAEDSNNEYSTNKSPVTAEDYFYLALNNKADFQYKIDNYTKCLRIDPDFIYAYAFRGQAYYRLGNYDDSRADYTRAIRIEPNEATFYWSRGLTFVTSFENLSVRQLGRHNEAIADFTKAINIDPEFIPSYKSRGIIYLELGKYYDAIADFSQVIRIEPDDIISRTDRARAYEKIENWSGAKLDYNKCIEIDPNEPFYYLFRGLAQTALDGKEFWSWNSCNDFNRACELDPRSKWGKKACEFFYKFCTD